MVTTATGGVVTAELPHFSDYVAAFPSGDDLIAELEVAK